MSCAGFDHLVQGGDETSGNPFAAHPWRRRNPQKIPKIAFRPNPEMSVHMGNHDVSNVPGGRVLGLQLRNIQYRSLEQMTRKLRQAQSRLRGDDDPSDAWDPLA